MIVCFITERDCGNRVGVDDAVVDTAAKKLLTQVTELQGQLSKTEHERDEYRKLYLLLREQYEKLKRGLLSQKAERHPRNDDAQLTLAMLGMLFGEHAPAAEAASKGVEVPAHVRNKAVRKPLPENLPRVSIEVLPPEVEREGLDAFEVIGTETREVLERRSASVVVIEVIKKKFVRKEREHSATTEVLVAETPELPIPRGVAGPGLLADTIVRRWQDHLPLNRLEGIYARDGVEIARSTMCTWHETLAELARPVVEAMHADARGQPYLCTDATGVLVQAPERCRNGHFWVLVAPGKHVLFEFSMRHDSAAVDQLLGGYQGYLVADAHVVYDHLYATGRIIEVGCWAHCRRYFYAARESDPERADHALAKIQELFLIERVVARLPGRKRMRARQEKSQRVVDAFFDWCAAERDLVLDGAPIADAIRYASNQKDALQRFLDDPRLPLHNNISERNLRRQAIGRKNWLFVGSEDGARVNTVFVSLLASCQMHGIEPWGYLRDLLCLLPSWSSGRVLELAPAYWRQTLEQSGVQQRLESNIYRRVLLAEAPERVRNAA